MIPHRVEEWVTAEFGTWTVVADASWPPPHPRVWRLRAGEVDVFLKISTSPDAFERERAALIDAIPHVPTVTAPSLVASSEELLALVTLALPGVVVRTLDPTPAEVERAIHQRAGAAIGDVHRHGALHGRRADRCRFVRVASWLEAARGYFADAARYLGAAERRSVEAARGALMRSARGCEVGLIHGDFQPRNWLWSDPEIALFDFEETCFGLVVEDFAWLFATTWPGRPDLAQAFWSGYGRFPTEAETMCLAAYTVLGSLRYLAEGHRLGAERKIAHGMRALTAGSRVLERAAAS